MDRRRQLRLTAFLVSYGHHVSAWRDPSTWPGDPLENYIDFVREAERARLDAVFLADSVSVRLDNIQASSRRAHSGVWSFEPITLLSALSTKTQNIGLISTASTTFTEPYNLARLFLSLDQLSKGRAGWNLVTTSDHNAAANFGLASHVAHSDRYSLAEEFCDIVLGLWDSWGPKAFPADRQEGVFFDASQMRVLNHSGPNFRVRGPLNIPRSPQTRPLLVQAGSSEPGIELAARTADMVFTAQQDLEEAKSFYLRLKNRLHHFSRSNDSLLVMPGLVVTIGHTREHALNRRRALDLLTDETVGIDLLSTHLGVNLPSGIDVDGRLPELPVTEKSKSRQNLIRNLAERENLTIRSLYQRIAGGRGHWEVIGTAQDVADKIEEIFAAGAADGFNIMPATVPEDLYLFTREVVPILQTRGLFPRAYEGRTLRTNLGL